MTEGAEKLERMGTDFYCTLGTGMRRFSRGDLDSSTAESLHRQLDEFDSVRTRGKVESHSAYLASPYSEDEG